MPASAGLTNPSSYLRHLQEVSRWRLGLCDQSSAPLCVCMRRAEGMALKTAGRTIIKADGSDKQGLSLGQETNLRVHLRQASLQFTMGIV